jgi:uncharacterized membrane protein
MPSFYPPNGYTAGMRFRLATMFGAMAVIALTLGFWSLNPGESMAIVPWALLTLLSAVVLITLVCMLRAFRRKPPA